MSKIEMPAGFAGKILRDYRDSLAKDLLDKFVVEVPPGKACEGFIVEIEGQQHYVPWEDLPPGASDQRVRKAKERASARWAYENAKQAVADYQRLAARVPPDLQWSLEGLVLSTVTCGIAKSEYHEAAAAWTKSRRTGAHGAEVTNEAHVELQPKYQPAVDRHMARGLSYTKATEEVAAEFGVVARTVQNHTQNKSPRHGSRHRKRE